MNDTTDRRKDLRDALQQARARRLARDTDPDWVAAVRERDDAFVRGALARRDQVRRLRLADDLPPELGGRRMADPAAAVDARRQGVSAACAHLRELGLWGEASAAELRRLWKQGVA